jgi:hypothetical protein
MKKLPILFFFLIAMTFFLCCGKDQPTTPTTPPPPPIPDCQKYHTGTLKVENRSKRNLDYNVLIDNINYGRLKVGEIRYFEVSVGSHTLAFPWADHDGYACSTSWPSILECQTTWIYCDQ